MYYGNTQNIFYSSNTCIHMYSSNTYVLDTYTNKVDYQPLNLKGICGGQSTMLPQWWLCTLDGQAEPQRLSSGPASFLTCLTELWKTLQSLELLAFV